MLKASTCIHQRHLQFTAYLSTLFHRSDLVEVRAIRNLDDGSSEVVKRHWQLASEISGLFEDFRSLNETGANIYIGVNPRVRNSGTKQSVEQCRCVWADFDDIGYEAARDRWEKLLPEPSMVVASGHGIHAYWKLDIPTSVASTDERKRFETMLKCFYRELGADSTQDVSRLLRVPGFNNVKAAPVPCRMLEHGPSSVSIERFDRWFAQAEQLAFERASMPPTTAFELPVTGTLDARVHALVASLDRPTPDRSRRDFAVVCELLKLGLPPDEIKTLVEGRSKFQSKAYADTTIKNAIARLFI